MLHIRFVNKTFREMTPLFVLMKEHSKLIVKFLYSLREHRHILCSRHRLPSALQVSGLSEQDKR